MTETLQGKHIVVTGGTGALGAAVVGKLLGEGATALTSMPLCFSSSAMATVIAATAALLAA